MIRRFALVLAMLAVGGCGSVTKTISGYVGGGESNVEPPTPLVEFTPLVKVEEVWSTSIGKGAREKFLRLEPVALDDAIYIAENSGRVAALNLGSGKQIWEHDTDAPISGGPGVGEGLVAVGTSDGDVIALSQTDGKELWRAQVTSEVLASPRVANGVVIVRTGDGKVFGLGIGSGERTWVYDRTVPTLTLRGTSPPVIAGDTVIAGFDSGRLVALDINTGKLLWEASIATPRGRSDLERMVDIDAEPVVYEDNIYVATFQGRLAAVSIDAGQVVWGRDLSSYAGVAVDATNVYLTDDESQVWALDRLGGASVWKQEMLRNRAATAPVSAGDYVVVGDIEGYLHWLRRDDGQFAARTRLGDQPIIASPLVVGDLVIAYSSSGALAAYRTL